MKGIETRPASRTLRCLEVDDYSTAHVREQLRKVVRYREQRNFELADFVRSDLEHRLWKVSVGLGDRDEVDRWWAGRHLTVTVTVPGATATKRLRVVLEEP